MRYNGWNAILLHPAFIHTNDRLLCTQIQQKTADSNTFPDVSSQKAFVCHLLTQIHSIESFARMDTKTFMSTVGLMSPTETEEHINNRKVLLFSVNMALGLMRRTDKKENLVPEILPLIRSLVSLLCILNEMWDPSFRSLCNPALADKVFSPATDSEKNHLLEFVQSTPSSNAVPPVSYFSSDPETHVVNASQFQIDKILQSFLASLYEILLTILGLSCSFFPSIIFVIPSASPNEIVTTHPFLTVLNKSHYLPRMRLRTMLKQFLLPFIKHCPLQEENVKSCLFPLFSTFIPWMFKHIDDHWDIFRNRSVTTTDDDERLEHEVIEDQSNRILSKEFLDLMSSAFIYTPPGKHTCSSTSGTTEQETEMDSTTRDDIVNDSSETVISEVGKCLLRNDLASMVRIIFGQLTWVDSILCLKASRTICRVILRELLSYRLISTADDVSFFVHHVFFSLKLFGENEENVSSLLQLVLILWEGLIKNNEPSDVKAPLWLLSSRQAGDWLSLEESLIRPSLTSSKNSKVNDKKKKDAIKPLLTNVIGVSFCVSSPLLLCSKALFVLSFFTTSFDFIVCFMPQVLSSSPCPSIFPVVLNCAPIILLTFLLFLSSSLNRKVLENCSRSKKPRSSVCNRSPLNHQGKSRERTFWTKKEVKRMRSVDSFHEKTFTRFASSSLVGISV